MSVESYLAAVPKAELHVHLEGAVRPATLLGMAQRNGVELPYRDEASLRQWFTFTDFSHFITVYQTISRCFCGTEDYELAVVDLAASLAAQHVRYAEVTFSPSNHHRLGVDQTTYLEGLRTGRRRALAEHGVRINWVFDIGRRYRDRSVIPAMADYTTSVAIESQELGVVALGLGGPEEDAPPEPFAPYFERARVAGLRSTPHASELAGPESAWGALRALHADRLGHGVRAIEDPDLVAHLAEHQVPLEVCPTSNLRLGLFPGYAQHPLPNLLAAGVPMTVNTDDPALFNSTLTGEIVLLLTAFGLSLATIEEVVLNGVRHSFIPKVDRELLEQQFRLEMAELRERHLPDDSG